MEIIDRPLSEIIKEQGIDKDLRRRRRRTAGGKEKEKASNRPRADAKAPSRRRGGPIRRDRQTRRGRPTRRVVETRRRSREEAIRGGVKSRNAPRRSRISGAVRNERTRNSRRREILSRSRFSD
ncbi:unnamed protein product [Phytomonas sp. Hart1]|nr:unnamed protein product [Phytomonas sp. Hart1]|eukprot:CCW66608.1 unnamed protein product [Phytomonas sp. isolate Hart1]